MNFDVVYERAVARKGGEDAMKALLTHPKTIEELRETPDDRVLSAMTRGVFQAGFTWRVIAQKWPGFEEAFHGFDVDRLVAASDDDLAGWLSDTRIVRNGQKIRTVLENAAFVKRVREESGSFGAFLADWPPTEQVALFAYLKKHGARLGGNTARWFLRYLGYDSFVLSSDVVATLRGAGLTIANEPTSKRDLQAAQDQFNRWHRETGMGFSHLSQIAAFSCGINKHADEAETAMANGEIPQIG